MSKKKLLLISVIGFLILEAALIKWRASSANAPKIVLNEVCALTGRAIKDGVNDGSDYIELYNCSDEVLSLEGWYISDDQTKPQAYMLPAYIIEPGQYLVLYANGTEGEHCVPFRISDAGEKLFLSEPGGSLVDSVVVPKLTLDAAYSRVNDGEKVWSVKAPTPAASNETGEVLVEAVLEVPGFSAEGGFYDKPFELTLTCKSGQTIYYTLDGSEPGPDSLRYEGPIKITDISGEPNKYVSQQRVVTSWKEYEPDTTPVDKGTVVRAIAVDGLGRVSKTVTETYFVGQDKYKDMTVMSLVAEPDELYGEEGIFVTGKLYDEVYATGEFTPPIYANFQQRGRGWEVTTDMEFFVNGDMVADQTVGIRVQGNSGRSMAQKRLSIFSRTEYSGSEYFDESFVGKDGVHSVMINEFASNVALPRLVEDRAVGIQTSRTEPVAVFINGEYWYTRYMMEKFNTRYIEEMYDVNRDNVLIMKNDVAQTGVAEHDALYRGMQALASAKDLTPDEKYAKLSEVIDMQSFIDFFASSIYLCNMNMNEIENYVLWRAIVPEDAEYGDSRWRWLLFDVEAVESLRLYFYGFESRAEINSFSQPQDWTGYIINENSIYQGLKDCETFRRQFVTTFLDIANVNFAPERVEKLLAEYDKDLTWLENFFLKRFDYIVEDLKEEFALGGELSDVTLEISDADAGRIILNTTEPDLSGGNWTGRYYTDYPVTVTVVANDGYRFAGWEGSFEGTENSAEIPLVSEGITLKAVFEKE